jgi:hypothetical protein
VNCLANSLENAKEMLNELVYIMKNCSKDEEGNAINRVFIKFANEENFLDYF